MKPPRIRTLIWMVFAAATLTAAGVAAYALVRVAPAARQLRVATEPLRRLYGRIGEDEHALASAVEAAERVVRREDPADTARLRSLLRDRDRLVGELPLADVPVTIRIPLARAEELASRLVVMLDEILALVELERWKEAEARLAQAQGVRMRLRAVLADAQVRGLDDVVRGQKRLEELGGEMARAFGTWLIVALLAALFAQALFWRRIAVPMAALRRGLEQVEHGDLSVTLQTGVQDEMGELTAHFNRMTSVLRDRAAAQGQVAAASELLAGVAHEVNNPLMAITATVEMTRADPALSDEARVRLAEIEGQARRAGRLVSAIIRFIRPPSPIVEPLEVNAVLGDAWHLVSFLFRADGVGARLTLQPDLPLVEADAHRLGQVFVNLLSNAHQAVMRSAGERNVAVRTAVDSGRVIVEIRDTGPGVPEEARAQVFRPFYTTAPGGHAGLGLYVSRLIVRELGGEIEYREPEGEGALFVVTLPASSRPRSALAVPRAAEATSEPTRLAGLHVLLVDDEAVVRRPIARFLALRGARVREASDGLEALASLAEGRCDVVLADLRMPRMDGVELYRVIQRRDPWGASRVLFLSGDVAQLADLRADEIPPDRVLTKPIELADLERRLVVFVGQTGATWPS